MATSPPVQQQQQRGPGETVEDTWEYSLRKYLLLLALLVATVTYGVGFSPPGGVWEDDAGGGHLAGDPIIRDRSYKRYYAFFYFNATAFASSLVVIVLILILAVLHEKKKVWVTVLPLRVVMVLDLLSLMGAYAAGTCRDKFTTIYSSLLVSAVFAYLVVQMLASLPERDSSRNNASLPEQDREESTGCCGGVGWLVVEKLRRVAMILAGGDGGGDEPIDERLRKVLMLLATFAVSVTYVAGLTTPGGFWVDDGPGHRAGDAILKNRYGARLTAFFVCNTTSFVASLLIVVLLLDRKLRAQRTVRSSKLYGCIVVALYGSSKLYGCIVVALAGLVGAYAAGGCREADTTAYVLALVGAILAYMFVFHVLLVKLADWWKQPNPPNAADADADADAAAAAAAAAAVAVATNGARPRSLISREGQQLDRQQLNQARSLVLLLATLAATITYQAGLDPPGGLWQKDDDAEIGRRYMAGDPILLTVNPRRFKVFFYCNSVAFVASLVTVVLVQREVMLKHHALEAAMVLDLFGLIGAYAAGSCRDVSTSIYVMALAGAVLVYVVIHVIFFTLDSGNVDDVDALKLLEKRRKRLLLFAILAATITYQSGLTPPGGFNDSGVHAGNSVLLENSSARYNAFFYCNSASFMLSVALIVLLVNPNLYRPAIRSWALSVCTAAGMFGLMGAYAAGSTQYVKTSIYIFVLVAVVIFSVLLLLLAFLWKKGENIAVADTPATNHDRSPPSGQQAEPDTVVDEDKKAEEKKIHAKRKYLMLLGILVASITYQAGLRPPGGFWQNDSGDGRHRAGNPVMHDNRRARYLLFFYSNSTSFEASIVVIMLLLLPSKSTMQRSKWWLKVMDTTLVLDLIGLLVAYAAGSNRHWKTSVYVVVLIFAVLAYVAIHVMLSWFSQKAAGRRGNQPVVPSNGLQVMIQR